MNRSKAPLALMEQAVMVLVFALAAALCLRVFVWSDQTSRRCEARDRAAVEAQSAAEVIKREGKAGLTACYDRDWNLTNAPAEDGYTLTAAEEETGVPGLGRALVRVETGGGEPLFELHVAWQKGAAE